MTNADVGAYIKNEDKIFHMFKILKPMQLKGYYEKNKIQSQEFIDIRKNLDKVACINYYKVHFRIFLLV